MANATQAQALTALRTYCKIQHEDARNASADKIGEGSQSLDADDLYPFLMRNWDGHKWVIVDHSADYDTPTPALTGKLWLDRVNSAVFTVLVD